MGFAEGGYMGYGNDMQFPANQVGRLELWVIRGYGLSEVWVKRGVRLYILYSIQNIRPHRLVTKQIIMTAEYQFSSMSRYREVGGRVTLFSE